MGDFNFHSLNDENSLIVEMNFIDAFEETQLISRRGPLIDRVIYRSDLYRPAEKYLIGQQPFSLLHAVGVPLAKEIPKLKSEKVVSFLFPSVSLQGQDVGDDKAVNGDEDEVDCLYPSDHDGVYIRFCSSLI